MGKNKYLYHEPVMLSETLKFLDITRLAHLHGSQVIDATLGFAGHSLEILKKGVSVFGIEEDSETLKMAVKTIESARPVSKKFGSYKIVNANFKDIAKLADENGIKKVNAVLFDLGVSSYQLTSPMRGFSFLYPQAHLDMRLDPNHQAVNAAMLLNALDKTQLTNLFAKVLDFRLARKAAESIVKNRKIKPFTTVLDLLNAAAPLPKPKNSKINGVTKIFLALRMAVNSELENLKIALPQAFQLLESGGRLVVITFHSGEDSIVKSYFNFVVSERLAKKVTHKPVEPSETEIKRNSRSRSAKIRCIEKI